MSSDLEQTRSESEHGVNCGPGGEGLCTRCAGFLPGNDVGQRHGAYSAREIEPLAESIFEALCAQAPVANVADDHARRLVAGRLAQIELGRRWVFEHGVCDENGDLRPIVGVLVKWENGARQMLRELGLTTLSRAELGLEIARTAVAVSEVQELMRRMNGLITEFVPEERRGEFGAAWDERIAGQLGGGGA
jgi:hypothetical protein